MLKKILYPLVLIALIAYSNAHPSSIKQLDIDQLISQSELVFKGQVVDIQTNWNTAKTEIFTQISFRVDDIISGTLDSNNLTLSFVGGTVNGETVIIEGSAMPEINERGIYFVSSTKQQLVNPLVGWAQGHYITQKDQLGVERLMTQSKNPIESIDINLKKRNYLSKGSVTGVKKVSSGHINQAMSVESFKSLIQGRVKALKQKKYSEGK